MVEIAGVNTNPDGAFMAQVARNLTDGVDGCLSNKQFLILDRDSKFTAQFRRILKDAGVEVVTTAFHAPNMNALAERFVQSVKRECLERLILFGSDHLRRALNEFVAHYPSRASTPRTRQQGAHSEHLRAAHGRRRGRRRTTRRDAAQLSPRGLTALFPSAKQRACAPSRATSLSARRERAGRIPLPSPSKRPIRAGLARLTFRTGRRQNKNRSSALAK